MKANYKNQPATLETGMTLYDLNKQLVNQLPTLTKEQLQEKYFLIDEFGKGKTWCMLLAKYIGYYTIFHHIPKDDEESFASAVIDCCLYQGNIKSIDWANDSQSMIEIWITIDEESYVFYLFDYEMGVIECQM